MPQFIPDCYSDLIRECWDPNPEKRPIVVLGDSHAMGWGVNDNETFSYILWFETFSPPII